VRNEDGRKQILTNPSANGVRNYGVKWCTFAAIAVSGAAADLWTKSWIFGWLGLPGMNPPYWIIEPYFGLETAVNPGAVFGMGAGLGLVFAALSIAASIGIAFWLTRFGALYSWWLVVSLGMVQGGIIGNLYDRMGLWNPPKEMPTWSSGVRDWIRLSYGEHVWPNFNIADSLLVCGAIMLAAHSFFHAPNKDEPPTNESANETANS
jgi:signal peptidase II